MKVYKEKAGELLMLLLPLFGSDPDRLIAVDRYSYERKITTFKAWVLRPNALSSLSESAHSGTISC